MKDWITVPVSFKDIKHGFQHLWATHDSDKLKDNQSRAGKRPVGKLCNHKSDKLLLFTTEASSSARTAQHQTHTLDTASTMTAHGLWDPIQARSRWRHRPMRAPSGRACPRPRAPCDSRAGIRFWLSLVNTDSWFGSRYRNQGLEC